MSTAFLIDFFKKIEESVISPQRISRLNAKLGDRKENILELDKALYRSKQENINNNKYIAQNIENAFLKLSILTNSHDIIVKLLENRAKLTNNEIPHYLKSSK